MGHPSGLSLGGRACRRHACVARDPCEVVRGYEEEWWWGGGAYQWCSTQHTSALAHAGCALPLATPTMAWAYGFGFASAPPGIRLVALTWWGGLGVCVCILLASPAWFQGKTALVLVGSWTCNHWVAYPPLAPPIPPLKSPLNGKGPPSFRRGGLPKACEGRQHLGQSRPLRRPFPSRRLPRSPVGLRPR